MKIRHQMVAAVVLTLFAAGSASAQAGCVYYKVLISDGKIVCCTDVGEDCITCPKEA